MVRALHVVPAIAARYGGPSVAALGMCRALNAAGHRTMIVTTDADGAGRLTVRLGEPRVYEGADVMFFRRRFSEAYKWSGDLSAWLDAHVAEFDVVHIHAVFSHSSIAAGRACRSAGVPYIVRPLGTLDPWSVNRKRFRKRALLRLGADRLLRGATCMHYTTIDEQRLAESTIADLPPAAIVPNGVDDTLFADGTGDRRADPSVVYLGRLDEKKGIDLLIQSFHALAADRQHQQWRLVIAGNGQTDYVARLRTLAHDGPAASRVAFEGWVDGPAKTSLLRRAGVFVLPSHQENFGISAAEALAAGVPVVITRAVNLAADVETAEAGWVVDRSVAALTELLTRVLGDAAELGKRGHNGRRLAERFRWNAVAGELIAMYERVIVRCAA
jgi:glycosyltransferase involved in cell wall biosynthesis